MAAARRLSRAFSMSPRPTRPSVISARELARAAGSGWLESVALGNLGAAKRELGDISAALADAEAGIAIARSSSDPSQLLLDLAEYALTLLAAARVGDAETVAAEVAALHAAHEAESLPFFPTYVRALVARAAGRAEADRLVRQARSRLEAFLSTLDPVGRDEMRESSFVRPLWALGEA